jgi:hypothetical protein
MTERNTETKTKTTKEIIIVIILTILKIIISQELPHYICESWK